ncbi:hypothetical protein [Bacillus cereus]|uniref:hypothetical protein n=1 Tax=Bacillus cereus TaxID=1396 RepID=UPI000B4B8B12|nr:hypothetical protein [Bacillus cereus]
MVKEKVVICQICGNDTPYKTNKPTSCRECQPFWKRARDIMKDDRRHTAHFQDEVAFAIFIKDKFFEQKERCKYSDIQMFKKSSEDPYPVKKEVYDLFKFSVERLDSKEDYTSSNTVICCYIYNIMKSNTELARFVELLTDLLKGLYKRSLNAVKLNQDTQSDRDIIFDIFDFNIFYEVIKSDRNILRTDEEFKELVENALKNGLSHSNESEGALAKLQLNTINNTIIMKNRDRELLRKALEEHKSKETIAFLIENSTLSIIEIEQIKSEYNYID